MEATPDCVIATPGGKWALYVILMSVLNPGDEVLILDPVWVSYDPMVRITGGVPVHVALDYNDDFAVHRAALEAAVTEKTKLVMLNSPNNPTGYVLSTASLQAAAQVCRDHDLYLLSDEIYEHILYDGHTHVSPATLPDMAERTFIVNGFSKAYAMTGWRLGWIWGPPDAIRIGRSYMTNSVTSAASFTMAAGVAALNGPPGVRVRDDRRLYPAARLSVGCPGRVGRRGGLCAPGGLLSVHALPIHGPQQP